MFSNPAAPSSTVRDGASKASFNTFKVFAAFLLFSLAGWGFAVTPTSTLAVGSGSAAPGSSVALNVTLTNANGAQPTAIQWKISYPAADISSFAVSAGASASAASKLVSCAPGSTAGTQNCVIYGLNQTAMANGVVATLTMQVAPSSLSTSVPIGISGVAISDAAGMAIEVSPAATSGAITVVQTVLQPSTLSCSPSSVTAPGSSTCTVGLSGNAPAGGKQVTLTSGNSNVTVPASVTVAAGASSATFTATVAAVTTNQTAILTATLSGVSKTFTLSAVAPVLLSTISCSPAIVLSGQSTTCTVTLNKAAASGGFVVSLSSNNSALSVPSSVTVPSGSTSGSFTRTSASIGSVRLVTVTGAAGSVVKTAAVTVRPLPQLTKVGTHLNGAFSLDDGNLTWSLTGGGDRQIYWSLGYAGESPLMGDWNGDGKDSVGLYVDGTWILDFNDNGTWDGPSIDKLVYFGGPGYTPVIGDWTASGTTKIGVHQNGTWMLDYDGNFTWDGAGVDKLLYFGGPGYTPLVGDWNGSGPAKIGVHKDGTWLLDYNGNFSWDGTSVDKLIYFGGTGHTPMVGDWNGSGTAKIAAQKDGLWVVDFNGNFSWDGTTTDKLIFFGGVGYTPVAGDWSASGPAKVGAFNGGQWVFDVNGNYGWDPPNDKVVMFGSATTRPLTGKW